MSSFIISTDANSDLPESYITENNLNVLPLYYQFDDVVYGGDQVIPPKQFYDRMRSGEMPTSIATNLAVILESFSNILDQGNDILHISFSSGLSSSYENACMCAKELREEYPERKIIIIDSLCASMGEGLLVHYAIQEKNKGNSIEEVAEWLQENVQSICHQFTVDDLFHLHRGGRVSKTTALVGTIANIKPLLHVDETGHLTSIGKTRGRKQSLKKLVEKMEETIGDYENKIVFISHGDCEDDAKYVANLIKEKFGIEEFLINYINPSIGVHSGPGTVALFYRGKER